MRAVWTFWSEPYRSHYHRYWLSERHHLFAWVLSVLQASRHYPDTCLSTDSRGAAGGPAAPGPPTPLPALPGVGRLAPGSRNAATGAGRVPARRHGAHASARLR